MLDHCCVLQAKAAGLGQAPGQEHAADVAQLQEEVAVLKQRVEANPEVKRFAGALRGCLARWVDEVGPCMCARMARNSLGYYCTDQAASMLA